MKKQHFILLLTSTLLSIAQSQTVQIGNTTRGVTASGNSLSINNGTNSIQIGGLPPLLQGAINATKEAFGSNDKTNQENMEKINIAKNNFIKEDRNNNVNQEVNPNKKSNNQKEPEVVRGQDLNVLKTTIVTNNIGFYNKTTIGEIEKKAKENNSDTYSKFPEYMIKNY